MEQGINVAGDRRGGRHARMAQWHPDEDAVLVQCVPLSSNPNRARPKWKEAARRIAVAAASSLGGDETAVIRTPKSVRMPLAAPARRAEALRAHGRRAARGHDVGQVQHLQQVQGGAHLHRAAQAHRGHCARALREEHAPPGAADAGARRPRTDEEEEPRRWRTERARLQSWVNGRDTHTHGHTRAHPMRTRRSVAQPA